LAIQNQIESGRIFEPKSLAKTWLLLFVVLGALYATWLLAFWPGVLGEDSLAIMLEVESQGGFESRKPNFWHFFVKAFYEPQRLVERPIMVQMAICALILSRILAWCWCQGFRKIFFFLLVFICIAPHMIYFMGLLNADGLFAVGTTGFLFEIWLVSKAKRIGATSFALIAISLPFAIFFRVNGVVSLIPIVVIGFTLAWPERLKLLAITAFWLILMLIADEVHKADEHGVLFPLAAFETANFLQPRPMHLRDPFTQVSGRTIQILSTHHPIQKTIEYYDKDYWDPLVYYPGGPDLLRLNSKERSDLVHDFFTYNLGRNIPAFAGSRLNVFVASLMAEGGFANLEDSDGILKRSKSQSEFRAFHISGLERILKATYVFSFVWRWLLWTPLPGIVMLFYTARVALKGKDAVVLSITVPMILQLGGIFIFSIASEYRYLLPFFVLPMVLLPILFAGNVTPVAVKPVTP
jgi:hypothetical protein